MHPEGEGKKTPALPSSGGTLKPAVHAALTAWPPYEPQGGEQ